MSLWPVVDSVLPPGTKPGAAQPVAWEATPKDGRCLSGAADVRIRKKYGAAAPVPPIPWRPRVDETAAMSTLGIRGSRENGLLDKTPAPRPTGQQRSPAVTVRVCSLIRVTPQPIPADEAFHIVRFPFGAAESLDEHGMHQVEQPDGHRVDDWDTDDRSGLIWPAGEGWGALTAMIQWENGDYTELRDQYIRDPLNLSTGPDTTATDHRPRSPGMQCFTKHHEVTVRPGTPIALRVRHNDGRAQRIVHAQFKLAIHT